MLDDEWSDISTMPKLSGNLLMSKTPFGDLAMSKSLNGRSSPFNNIFPADVISEGGLKIEANADSVDRLIVDDVPALSFFDHDEQPAAAPPPPMVQNIQKHATAVADYSAHFFCQKCNYTSDQRKEFMAHKRTHAGEKSFSCEMCSAKFTRRYSLKKHLNQKHGPHTSSSLTKYCPYPSCKFMTRNASAMQVHRRSRHTSLYFCKSCNAKYSLRRSLLHHLTLHHRSNADFFGVRAFHEDIPPSDIDTDLPGAEVVSQSEMFVQTEEEDPSTYRCDKCQFSAVSLRGLYNHKRFKHPSKRKSKAATVKNHDGDGTAASRTRSLSSLVDVEDSSIEVLSTVNQMFSPVHVETTTGCDELTLNMTTHGNESSSSRRRMPNCRPSPKCYAMSTKPSAPNGMAAAAAEEEEKDDEVSKLTELITCLQQSNTMVYGLYQRKADELEKLKRQTASFVRRVLSNHPMFRTLTSWKDVESAMQCILNNDSNAS